MFINYVKRTYKRDELLIFWIDTFCGAGGTSTGIHFSNITNMFVAACVNHDQVAIDSHAANHPHTLHFTEDIRDFKVVFKLKMFVEELRKFFPECLINFWASLECINFSRAKGGLPRDADSRSLAEHMEMYLEALKPDYFYVENVREFMSWGPLDENGKPVSKTAGTDYVRWVDEIKSLGFNYDKRILNAADFGSYQSRERLFIQFSRIGLPISWPDQTHSKKPDKNSLFPLQKRKPVRDILDLKDKGNCIFAKVKSDKTYKRILEGAKKEINKEVHFLTSYYGNGGSHSIGDSCNTLTTKDRFALHYMQYDYSKLTTSSVDSSANTVTTTPKHNLMCLDWLMDTQFGRTAKSLDESCFTVIARLDKKPIYLLQTERGYPKDFIKESDSEIVKELKEFMILNGIQKIYIRMLKIAELKKIQGFPENYILTGNQTQQKKHIGNAVDVWQAKAIIRENYNSILRKRIKSKSKVMQYE
ncbi:DNA cytosine methyltransferase [Flavobacterium sp. KB82]|uniref:DNA (cytosine-5-)-methyltransferase n=2 Tax=Flavobacterium hungaricum TaxID=2082725 RepID=A0ABR9TT32_9FLAO|nr:DNA cytosine methyltransferase [Flavobacterium hungaricum]